MKIDPGFPNHWKTEKLISELGGDGVVAVLRLWGNAQIRREWKGIAFTPKRLAMETKWKGDANHLWQVFTDPDAPWLDLADDGTYAIHGFEEYQKQVIHLWKVGPDGGRPKKDSSSYSCSSSYPISKANGNHLEKSEAPARIEFPDFPPEPNGKHPKEASENINALADRVRALRPEWQKMALTYAEMRSLTECAASLEGLDAEDWENIRRYLAAKLPEGSGGWQPRSRSKFLESAPDVYSHAAQWAAKNKPASTQPRTGGWK